ncbi:MAG: TetR/AcrR family transcriptional regulator [Ignavibacteriaceae bacterium]|nr:TetR/AcrR family transcriptional regulator [Ignavibacteriaceae bacterium]
MEPDKQKILKYCQGLFLKDGFYKVSVDEIANELKMSKKTIYKYFPSKQILVKEVIFDFILANTSIIKGIVDQDSDAVSKFHLIVRTIAGILMRGMDRLFGEIQRHMPELWEEIDSFRSKLILENFSRIIEQGKKEKYFIDIPTTLILNVFLSAIRGVVTPQFLMNNKFSAVEALNHTISILMNGILTEKGKKIFNRLKTGEDQ